jgi:hypothetical protein
VIALIATSSDIDASVATASMSQSDTGVILAAASHDAPANNP